MKVELKANGKTVQVEIPEEQLKETVLFEQLKKLGFSYITLDMEGFRSGSMDEKILKVSRKNT